MTSKEGHFLKVVEAKKKMDKRGKLMEQVGGSLCRHYASDCTKRREKEELKKRCRPD